MKKGIDYIGIAVVPFLHNGNGEYLFGLRTEKCRDEHGCWEAIGGGSLEHGESAEEGIAREVQEEVGAKPFNIEPLGYREVFRELNGQVTHWIVFDYRVQVNPEDVRIMEPDMCAELRWCAIDAMPEPKHSQFPVFLTKYKDFL
ncbi:MAG: NUDIX domain-containing protein [Candidatus Paceibacterota bacterium]